MGEVFRISSVGIDRMGAKIKTPKIPRASNKTPQKSLDQRLTPKKSHAEFLTFKMSRKKNKRHAMHAEAMTFHKGSLIIFRTLILSKN